MECFIMAKTISGIDLARALCEVQSTGYYSKDITDILTNEVLRGRLEISSEKFLSLATLLKEINALGISYKNIIILRSLFFEFEEIKEFAERKSKDILYDVIVEYEIENPEVESVIGQTSDSITPDYVSLEDALDYEENSNYLKLRVS